MNQQLACVPVCNHFERDNRVLRTCRFLRDRGYEVMVLALGREGLPAEEQQESSIRVRRFQLPNWIEHRKKNPGLGPAFGFATYVLRAVNWVRRHNPSVLHLNDWETVPIALLSGSFGRRKTVYDMHEFFQDRDSLEYGERIRSAIVRIDIAGLRRSNAVICVSDLIGQELRRVTDKPVFVVRNIPELPTLGSEANAEVKRILGDGRRHIVFLGGAKWDRGLGEFLSVLRFLPREFALFCLSPKNHDLAPFQARIEQSRLADRVTIHDVIPHEHLMTTLAPAFAGLSLLLPETRKIAFALPNKLFEYLHAGLPVICNDAPAQAELVRKTRAGLVLDLANPESAAASILSWDAPRIDRETLAEAGLTWLHERKVLESVYDRIGA